MTDQPIHPRSAGLVMLEMWRNQVRHGRRRRRIPHWFAVIRVESKGEYPEGVQVFEAYEIRERPDVQ